MVRVDRIAAERGNATLFRTALKLGSESDSPFAKAKPALISGIEARKNFLGTKSAIAIYGSRIKAIAKSLRDLRSIRGSVV
jgi:hypothetical protein